MLDQINSPGESRMREERAKAVARANNRDDDEWTYEARPVGEGWFIVRVLDKDGTVLGTL